MRGRPAGCGRGADGRCNGCRALPTEEHCRGCPGEAEEAAQLFAEEEDPSGGDDGSDDNNQPWRHFGDL